MLFEIKGVRNMGLSASQARLLNLTARMHDIEYKAQNLEAQKLQMSNESTHVYQEYEDAMNKQQLQLKHIGADGSASYKAATLADMQTAGYTFKVQTTTGWTDCATADAVKTALNGTSTDYTSSTQTISNLVEAGLIIFVKKDSSGTDVETNVATDTNLQQVSDESDLKKAEAKYEADMRKIDAKDKKFDTDLTAMETERNAIKTEMETLKTVAKDSVDRTFKLFS